MTYYDRADVPLQYELTDTFTVCDAYHCSVFGSTNPNRNYFWSGTTGNESSPVSPAEASTLGCCIVRVAGPCPSPSLTQIATRCRRRQ